MDDFVEDSDWYWIDYLENELDLSVERDLETLLAHSAEDRDAFENFRLLKQWVKDSDPLAGVDLESRLRRIHQGVMDEIRYTERVSAYAAPAAVLEMPSRLK